LGDLAIQLVELAELLPSTDDQIADSLGVFPCLRIAPNVQQLSQRLAGNKLLLVIANRTGCAQKVYRLLRGQRLSHQLLRG